VWLLVVAVAAAATAAVFFAITGGVRTSATDARSIGAVLMGSRNDRSYNQSVYSGLMSAKAKYDLDVTVVDNVSDPSSQFDTIRNLARTNALVIAASVSFDTAVARVARDFPDVGFVIVGGRTTPARNIHFVDIAPRAGGYLVGAVAATLTKTNTVGFIGGALIPPTTETEKGYKIGVEAMKPSVKVASVIVGSFGDPAKAKQAAAAQLASGADVIFGWLDAGYPGVIQAIRESGNAANGLSVAVSKCALGEEEVGDHILAYDAVTENLLRDYVAHDVENHVYGLEDPDVQRLQLCPAFNTPVLKALIAEQTKAIVSGEVDLGT
jgi:basic membrane protein A